MAFERLSIDEVVAIDAFIVPGNTALPATLGIVRHAATIFELVELVLAARKTDAPAILDFPDLDILQLINQKGHMFPIAAAVLEDVPGADYEVLFNNSSYSLPRVGMLDLMKALADVAVGANVLAQEATGDKRPVGGVSRIEDKMERRAEKISQGVVRRNIAKAPEPVSLSKASAPPEIDELDGDDE